MTKKLIVAVLVAPLVILGLSATICALASSTPLSNEDYSVYSALIRYKFQGEYGHFVADEMNPLLIRRQTNTFPNAPFQLLVFFALVENDQTSTSLPAAPLSIKRNQIARSWLDSSVEQQFDLDFPYRIVDEASEEINGRDAEPYLMLSRIGFDSNSSTALVHYWFVCGLCGGGGMILERTEKGWEVVEDNQQSSS